MIMKTKSDKFVKWTQNFHRYDPLWPLLVMGEALAGRRDNLKGYEYMIYSG